MLKGKVREDDCAHLRRDSRKPNPSVSPSRHLLLSLGRQWPGPSLPLPSQLGHR